MKSRRKRSMSYDASSISSKTDISKELDKNMGETYNNQVVQIKTFENVKKPLQSILKAALPCSVLKFRICHVPFLLSCNRGSWSRSSEPSLRSLRGQKHRLRR